MSARHGDPKRLTKQARQALYERSNGFCEWCGGGLSEDWFDAHHRKLRSRGGTWALSNLLAVHPDCHTNQPASIHMNPEKANRLGAMLHGWQDPGLAVVWINDAAYQLNNDGTREHINDIIPF